ncbi:TPA: hypothetical protein DDX30_04155 [Candidatus Wolfebacteria bacterium]|nr:hypothetical protein [Candidatus Wolfebacteria bacterium]
MSRRKKARRRMEDRSGGGEEGFHFSRYTFRAMRQRENTHYCFVCGGKFGFTPGRQGEVENEKDNKVTLRNEWGEEVLLRDALRDARLEKYIAQDVRLHEQIAEKAVWQLMLNHAADFEHTAEFVQWCKENGYIVLQRNPMEHHDPIAHANAVVGGADQHMFVSDWLRARAPQGFPYRVTIT